MELQFLAHVFKYHRLTDNAFIFGNRFFPQSGHESRATFRTRCKTSLSDFSTVVYRR